MKVISEVILIEDLESIARRMGIEIYEPTDNGVKRGGNYRGWREIDFKLRPGDDDEYRAIGDRGRRLWAVTWEGHRDFMRDVFKLDPEAVIDTAKAKYEGAEQFEKLHRRTYYSGNTLGAQRGGKVYS